MANTLVTGASGGIGRELAKQFAAGGDDLAIVARREKQLRELAADLNGRYDTETSVIAMDLAERDAAEQLIEQLEDIEFRVDRLVNNVGIGAYGPISETELRRERDQIRLNVELQVLLTKSLLPGMLERGHGNVLTVASIAGFVPGPRMAGYYASKAHALNFTEALAEELSGTGVTATVLCPGPVDTEFQSRAEMTDSRIGELFTNSAEAVAKAGYRGVLNGRTIVIPGLSTKMLYLGIRFTPRIVARKVVAWLNDEQ